MLDRVLAPAPRGLLKLGVVAEDPAQVMGIGRAVMLTEARRLDDAEDVGIQLRPIEALPGNIVERPRAHAASRRPLGAQCLYTNERNAVKSLSRGGRERLLKPQRLISARAWSLAWATLCCRSRWRNSVRRRSGETSSNCTRSGIAARPLPPPCGAPYPPPPRSCRPCRTKPPASRHTRRRRCP